MKSDEAFDRDALSAVLAGSSDPDNPDADQIHDLVKRTERIAVVGMSRDPAKAARRVPTYLAAEGAEIIPVNPHVDRLLGQPVRDRLADVTEPVDMVLVFRPGDEAGALIREAMTRPERPAIWLQEGIRADQAAAAARAAGFVVVQDLCMYEVHRALDTRVRTETPDHGPGQPTR
jgi:uncharacterized protein